MSENVNIYDRIDIEVNGQKLTARPIEFEMDENENPISAIKYETTCPDCGNSIQFGADEAVVVDGVIRINCPTCVGQPVHTNKPALSIKQQGQMIERPPQEIKKDRGCPFLDPIKLGIFDPVALYEIT